MGICECDYPNNSPYKKQGRNLGAFGNHSGSLMQCFCSYNNYVFPVRDKSNVSNAVRYTLSFQCPVFDSVRSEILAVYLHHHFFVIGPIADVHLGNRLAFEGDDVVQILSRNQQL
jgi:hypothetical protein